MKKILLSLVCLAAVANAANYHETVVAVDADNDCKATALFNGATETAKDYLGCTVCKPNAAGDALCQFSGDLKITKAACAQACAVPVCTPSYCTFCPFGSAACNPNYPACGTQDGLEPVPLPVNCYAVATYGCTASPTYQQFCVTPPAAARK